MKKIVFAISAIAMLTFSSCSIFVHTKHHAAGVSVGDNNRTPTDSTKTPIVNSDK